MTIGVRSREPIVELLRSRVFFDWFDAVGVEDFPAVFAGVFISVTVLPSLSVIVAPPLEYEPPTMPILAVVFVTETSVNVGLAFGNEALTATFSVVPSTAICAASAARPGPGAPGPRSSPAWSRAPVGGARRCESPAGVRRRSRLAARGVEPVAGVRRSRARARARVRADLLDERVLALEVAERDELAGARRRAARSCSRCRCRRA